MAAVTEPLRTEHRALKARFNYLFQVADRAVDTGGTLAPAAAGDLHRFLTGWLLPHLRAEDELLYPVVDGILGGTAATAALRRQHAEISRLAIRLGELRRACSAGPLTGWQQHELRRTLYGLQAILTLHLATEEEAYLSVLDEALSPEAATALFGRMNAMAVSVA